MITRTKNDKGFTLIEIMVSLVLLTIGVIGIMALQMTLMKSNRLSRELEQAKVFATQVMETIRGCDLSKLDQCKGLTVVTTDVTTPDNVIYHRTYTVTTRPESTGLLMVTTQAWFAEDGDANNKHYATMQMLRTTQEKL